MFLSKDLEQVLDDKNKKIQELAIRNESLDRETNKFLEELKVTAEQLSAFIENKDNFSEKNWQELQKEKEKLDRKLEAEISSITNPKEVKKTYKSRNVDHRWLFVR